MIFEGEYVTKLVLSWQKSHNSSIMDDILAHSQALVEVIVSKYDIVYREDLIQESMVKLHYACAFFKPEVSTLHNFFTTVIHNVCTTYVSKQEREYLLDDNTTDTDDSVVGMLHIDKVEDYDLLDQTYSDLLGYMRVRFPSIPATVLDDAVDVIYYGLRNGEVSRNIITDIVKITMSRAVALLLYNVSVIYLRWKNLSCAEVIIGDESELSLLQEVRLVVGDVAYSKLIVAFAGITVRFTQ